MSTPEMVVGLVAPVLAAGAAAVGAAVRDRRVHRNERVAWRSALADATAQTEFTRLWLEARIAAGADGPEKERIQRDAVRQLEESRQRVAAAWVPPQGPAASAPVRRRVVKFFDLPPASSRTDRALVVMFYLALLWCAMYLLTGVLMLVIAPFSLGDTGTGSVWGDLALGVGMFLFSAGVALAPVMIVRMALGHRARGGGRRSVGVDVRDVGLVAPPVPR